MNNYLRRTSQFFKIDYEAVQDIFTDKQIFGYLLACLVVFLCLWPTIVYMSLNIGVCLSATVFVICLARQLWFEVQYLVGWEDEAAAQVAKVEQ